MNEYWKEQAGLTPDEKQAFVDKSRADEARFRQSLRTIHSAAENRMRERTAKEQHRDALRESWFPTQRVKFWRAPAGEALAQVAVAEPGEFSRSEA